MAPGDLQRLSAAFGFCVPVSDLRSPTPTQVLALHLGEYRPFYLKREEDELAQVRLKEFGLLIMGRPLAGKTRMALEAILAVVPDGILLRFRGPEQLVSLDNLLIPTVAVDGKGEKAALVVLFDDLDEFEDAPFDNLIDRLTVQVSRLYVVATCKSGSAQQILSRPSLKNLSKGPFSPTRIVEIKPLTPLQAIQIEKEVWKREPGRNLGLDRTEVGVILGGSRILERSYAAIPEEGKLILRGLILAESMGSPSPVDLVRRIVNEVIQKAPLPSFDITLNALIEDGVLQEDGHSRLSFVSQLHRNKIYETHYGSFGAFKKDLSEVASSLGTKKDWVHLQALGAYWGDQLKDVAVARAVLEQSLGILKHEETLAILAYVLARSGEFDLAEARLNECLALLSAPDAQANVLIRFGDELLRHARLDAAIQHYLRAGNLARGSSTRIVAIFRRADALLLNREFGAAEPIYRELLDEEGDAKTFAPSRLLLAIVGQDRIEDAQRELKTQLRSRTRESKQLLAKTVLEDGERLFTGSQRLSLLGGLIWASFRDTSEGPTRTEDLLAFASEMLSAGYLSVSNLAYLDLHANSASLDLKPQQLTLLLNNLATGYLYSRDSAKARPLFEETLSLLRAEKQAPELYHVAAAEDGIAVCDMIDGRLSSAKELYEKMLRAADSEGNETVQAWAHVGLGRIAWQRGEASTAYDHYLSLRAIPSSFETVIRTDLGLAQVYLHFRMLDNAEFHIARGTAALVRADYAYLRAEFENLQKELEGLKRAAPGTRAISSQRACIDALIMKGGGVKGLAFAGAIRELEAFFQFRSFVGTSAGSIAAVLLAAGATGANLEKDLREKPFRDFLDGRWWNPFGWIRHGIHPGDALTAWIRRQLDNYVHNPNVEIRELPQRAVVYASTKDKKEVTFDSRGRHSQTEAHFAVRCSISIPYFFQPKELDGRRVYDGGLLNNYPVEIFLAQEKEKSAVPSFIALYLGSSEPAPLKSRTVFGDLLSIWVDRDDEQVIRQYRDQTVLIDTRPIKTTDFDLTDREKDFLVLQGHAAALEFLDRQGKLDAAQKATMIQTRAEAEKLREEIS